MRPLQIIDYFAIALDCAEERVYRVTIIEKYFLFLQVFPFS